MEALIGIALILALAALFIFSRDRLGAAAVKAEGDVKAKTDATIAMAKLAVNNEEDKVIAAINADKAGAADLQAKSVAYVKDAIAKDEAKVNAAVSDLKK
jgi:hypothetical protein